ncbi:MAG: hypothetical protein D3906_13245, partial [Candidatus Electrothrix sp. AUS1_2]|nr:hypothetical protein [Candidatus Electrothrix sp. AUS1_2]
FPLYIDSLPRGMTKALEIISSGRVLKKNFLAIVNNGLPEAYQNAVALTICRLFAVQCGMIWAGGISGGGEMLISGHSLKGIRGFRGVKRPPLIYATRALDIAAASLAAGCSIPQQAIDMIAKKPVPFISFNLWRWFLVKKTNSMLTKEAIKNGLTKMDMYNTPYAK